MIYTRCLAVAEVDAERGNAGIGRCTVLANLEVGTAGTDAGTHGGIVELALATHEQDVLVCILQILKLFLQILKLRQYTKLPFILQKEFLRFHEGSLERNKASMESQEPSVLQG